MQLPRISVYMQQSQIPPPPNFFSHKIGEKVRMLVLLLELISLQLSSLCIMQGDNTFSSFKACGNSSFTAMMLRPWRSIAGSHCKMGKHSNPLKNTLHIQKNWASDPEIRKKYIYYLLSEPLRYTSVTSSSLCLKQGQIIEEWQTNDIHLSQTRFLSLPEFFTNAPIIKKS